MSVAVALPLLPGLLGALALVPLICRCPSPQEHAQRAAEQARSSADADARQARRDAAAAVRRAEAEAAAAKKAAAARVAELAGRTPDPDDYEVLRVEVISPHMVLRVRYPSCARCAYEGEKVLVLLHTRPVDAMRWRRIDPHFRDPSATSPTEAPPPAARFPASDEGWADAVKYARSKAPRGGVR